MYRDVTSKLVMMVSLSSKSIDSILLMKSVVSQMYDLVFATRGLYITSMSSLSFSVGQPEALTIGLPGMFFLWILGSR